MMVVLDGVYILRLGALTSRGCDANATSIVVPAIYVDRSRAIRSSVISLGFDWIRPLERAPLPRRSLSRAHIYVDPPPNHARSSLYMVCAVATAQTLYANIRNALCDIPTDPQRDMRSTEARAHCGQKMLVRDLATKKLCAFFIVLENSIGWSKSAGSHLGPHHLMRCTHAPHLTKYDMAGWESNQMPSTYFGNITYTTAPSRPKHRNKTTVNYLPNALTFARVPSLMFIALQSPGCFACNEN